MRIAVTGAAGDVGRQALRALDDHDVTPLTHREHADLDATVVDIEDREAVRDALDGHDAVVHLAANPSPHAAWDDVVGPNIEGAYNVFEGAVAGGVDRVVFASSNHVQQNHVFDGTFDAEAFPERPPAVAAGDAFRPDSYYGVSKVTGEALGRFYADRHGLDVVSLRIGWLLTEDELRARQERHDGVAHFARAVWLSPRDCRDGIAKAVSEPLADSPVEANLASANTDGYFSLVEARRGFEYAPRDDSSVTLADGE